MKNNIIKMLTLMLLSIVMVTSLVGCDNDEYCQPTMIQIQQMLMSEENEPLIEGASRVVVENIIYDNNSYNNSMIDWSRLFERSNIDSSDFMTMDKYKCTGYFLQGSSYLTDDYEIYVFKFSDCDSAKNCKEKINFYQNYSAKQYGNLVVYADNIVAGHTFALIDTIEV